jgi:hypothetical protein
MDGACSMHRETRNAFKMLVRTLERCVVCHRWKDNVKMDLKGIWCQDVDWIQLA